MAKTANSTPVPAPHGPVTAAIQAMRTETALTVADLNHTINCEPRIMDVRLAEALGFEHPRRIRSLIERHRTALERFAEVCTTAVQTSEKGGRPGNASWLTKKQALYICTKSETPRATEITIEIVEVFEAAVGGLPVKVRAHQRTLPKRPDLRASR